MCANHAILGEIFYRKSRMTRSENYYPTLVWSTNNFLTQIPSEVVLSVTFLSQTQTFEVTFGAELPLAD